MTSVGINSGVSAVQQIEQKSKPAAVNTTQEPAKANSGLSKSDNLKTSGLSKNPVWEGVKLGAKEGAVEGLKYGPIAGAAGAAVLAGSINWIGTGKFNPMALGGKFILGGAALGLAAGPALGAYAGAREYGKAGIAVGVGVEHAKATGGDEAKSAKKAGQYLGAASGAVKGAYEGLKLSKSMSTQAKVGVTVGFAALGAAGGYVAGGVLADKVYKVAK